MLLPKTFKCAILSAVCLLGISTGRSADAQECRTNDNPQGNPCATEWSGGRIINLDALVDPGFNSASIATGINASGQVVGWGDVFGGIEWSGGSVINLSGFPLAINASGQVVGYSFFGGSSFNAAEWSGGSVINLGGGRYSEAAAINDFGLVVGHSGDGQAVEWSGDKIIGLGRLPGTMYSWATSINASGQVVGYSSEASAVTTTPPSGAATRLSTSAACRVARIASP